MPAPGTCGDCLRNPPALAETRAVFVYGFPLDRLVPRFKFHRDLAAGRLMADLMAGALASAPRPDALARMRCSRSARNGRASVAASGRASSSAWS